MSVIIFVKAAYLVLSRVYIIHTCW